jgi:hypothetical protein
MAAACTKCGTAITVEEGAEFARCFTCSLNHYVSGERLIAYTKLQPRLGMAEATQILQQWMAHESGVAGINGVAVLGQARGYDHLFWNFALPMISAAETHILVPATETILQELRLLTLPAQSLTSAPPIVEPAEDNPVPTVPLEAAWSQTGSQMGLESVQTALVRLPLYEFPYVYEGRGYRVIVEGMSGRCLVHRFPRKPMGLAAIILAVCLLAFSVEAWMLWGHDAILGLAFLGAAVVAGVLTYLLARRATSRGA